MLQARARKPNDIRGESNTTLSGAGSLSLSCVFLVFEFIDWKKFQVLELGRLLRYLPSECLEHSHVQDQIVR